MSFQKMLQTVMITATVIGMFLVASEILPTTDYIAWFVEGLISVLAIVVGIFAALMTIVLYSIKQNFRKLKNTRPYHWGFIVWIVLYYLTVLSIAWTSQWYYIFGTFAFMGIVGTTFILYYNKLHYKMKRG